jgi:5-methylcytosine-specific restriction endonuclease McrA
MKTERTRYKLCKCGRKIAHNEECCVKKNNFSKQSFKNVEESVKLMNTTRWRKLRKRILERDDFHCQRCFIKYKILTKTNLEVHHIKPRHKYPELVYDETNLVTICKTCNLQIGTEETLDFEFTPTNIEYNFTL